MPIPTNRMNIQEIIQKSKAFITNDEIFTILLVVFIGVASFGLGRASVEEKRVDQATPASVVVAGKTQDSEAKKVNETTGLTRTSDNAQGAYVASKNGTKYHLPWCAGAKSIKEENKIWFNSKEAAEAAGYAPAANCKGI